MNNISKDFLKNLIDKNIIVSGTEIDASYRGKDIAGDLFVTTVGTFIIQGITETTDGYQFFCASVIDGHKRALADKAIIMIDGMEPARLAETYGISLSGKIIPPGRRRGRKPKIRDTEAS